MVRLWKYNLSLLNANKMKTTIDKIWLTDTAVWIRTADGSESSESFSDYPRLKNATKDQLGHFETDDFGIHWPDIDEDLSFESFFRQKNTTPLYRLFMEHPELNASGVARRLGMKQSLLAAYITGAKKPSQERLAEILDMIHRIGEEICKVKIETL